MALLGKMTLSDLKNACDELRSFLRFSRASLGSASLPEFLKETLTLPEEIKYWPTLRHVQEWTHLVQTHQKLLVEASRDHFKSTFFSWAYPLFLVQRVRDPVHAFGIAMFSYSEGQAQKNLKRIRQEIESNPWLKWLIPKSKSHVWDVGTMDMSNGCWIEGYGFGSSFRGRHPKHVIVDDPSKDEGTGTMSLEQQIEFFSGVIVPAAKKHSQIVVTGNPVSKKDFLCWLEQNKAFSSYFYPILNSKGEPLAPEHYDHRAIDDKRMTIPAHIFAREYLLKRVSAEDAKFREEWIRYYESERIARKALYRIMTIDPALSPGGDAMAAIVTGTDANTDTYTLGRLSFRGDFRQGIGFLCDMMVEHTPDFIGIETFAFQRMYKIWLEDELKRRGLNFWVQEVGLDSRKTKAARIESLQPKLAQGKLHFLREHKPTIDQLLLWDPLSKTNEDDEIDALAWQVPLWRAPYEDAAVPDTRPRPGTFAEAFESMRQGEGTWLTRLFEDMRHA